MGSPQTTAAGDDGRRDRDDPETEQTLDGATTDEPSADVDAGGAGATPASAADDDENEDDDGIDRRRLIRWIAILAFGVPVAVEGFTFGSLLWDRFVAGDGTAGNGETGVGVGDELLPETAATETVVTSELRDGTDGQTYVLRVAVENDTDAPVELRLGTLTLADDTTIPGRSATGPVAPGERGEVTGAWAVGDGRPATVTATALRDGDVVRETAVALAPPSGDSG